MKKVIYCVSLLAVGYAAGRFSGATESGVIGLADSLARTADSVTVTVPIVARTYSDSMTYRAVVSGFEPRLDTLVIYPSPRVEVVAPTAVTERTRRHWGIGLTAGAAVTSHGIVPGLTVGVTYTFAAF